MEANFNIKSISLFSKPAKTVKPVAKVSLVDLYKLIIGDKYKKVTEELRNGIIKKITLTFLQVLVYSLIEPMMP